jgi:mannose-1-phosphate guanylyltransferase
MTSRLSTNVDKLHHKIIHECILKAVLLAGGRGTRARPFSDYIPKAMIPIEGRPLIDHVVRYLARSSHVDEIFVVCGFDLFGKQIINYFEGKDTIIPKKVSFVEDAENGTGGALLRTDQYIRSRTGPFLVWFVDNLCALNIEHLVGRYCTLTKNTSRDKEVTGIVVTRKYRYEETGRVSVDSRNYDRITAFTEKPIAELESPETLGIYLFTNRIFEHLYHFVLVNKKKKAFNLSHDVLAHLPSTGTRLYSYCLDNRIDWLDIESPVYADRNKKIISRIIGQMNLPVK